MSISRNVQGQKYEPHEKNYKKEEEHDGLVGTHDTNAHHEPEYIEYRNYEFGLEYDWKISVPFSSLFTIMPLCP